MDTRWTKHTDGEKKENLTKLLLNSQIVFRRFLDVLKEEENVIEKQERSISDFKDHNWSHKQAFRNGELTAYRKIRELLNFVK